MWRNTYRAVVDKKDFQGIWSKVKDVNHWPEWEGYRSWEIDGSFEEGAVIILKSDSNEKVEFVLEEVRKNGFNLKTNFFGGAWRVAVSFDSHHGHYELKSSTLIDGDVPENKVRDANSFKNFSIGLVRYAVDPSVKDSKGWRSTYVKSIDRNDFPKVWSALTNLAEWPRWGAGDKWEGQMVAGGAVTLVSKAEEIQFTVEEIKPQAHFTLSTKHFGSEWSLQLVCEPHKEIEMKASIVITDDLTKENVGAANHFASFMTMLVDNAIRHCGRHGK